MAVPDFQKVMLPLLEISQDGHEHSISQVIDLLASKFNLTENDRKELLPSGSQARFDNRVRWARLYLSKAGLLENIARGKFRVTELGLKVLKEKPADINIKFLKQFSQFLDFQNLSKQDVKQDEVKNIDEDKKYDELGQTPEEILEANYQIVRRDLAQELLERIKNSTPRFFENLVVDLLFAMGYGGSRKDAGQAVGQSGDDGIDGIIKEDRLGLDVVYIQAKRWEATVGRPIVQAFAGSLEGQRAKKGVLITTSQFSHEAKEYVNRIEKKIVLIDGERLTQLMLEYGVGVTEKVSYSVKKIDLDYFAEE